MYRIMVLFGGNGILLTATFMTKMSAQAVSMEVGGYIRQYGMRKRNQK